MDGRTACVLGQIWKISSEVVGKRMGVGESMGMGLDSGQVHMGEKGSSGPGGGQKGGGKVRRPTSAASWLADNHKMIWGTHMSWACIWRQHRPF